MRAQRLLVSAAASSGIDTNENEYVEVVGDPSADYSAFSVLEIEGGGDGAGIVDGVFGVGTTNADGYWWTGFLNNEIEKRDHHTAARRGIHRRRR